MKDWNTLQPDIIKLIQPHRYTAGRGGKKIEMVVIHHMAGVGTTHDVWNWWQTRAASAHYAVHPDGKIGQLVWDRDTAFHAANWDINQRSIGIEHSNSAGAAQDWPISDATLEEGAHLVAAICKFYKLGRPQSGKNVRFHREFTGTSCPHHLAPGGKYFDHYMRRAQHWYDEMTNPKPKSPAPPSSSSSPFGDAMTLIRSLINSAKSFTANGMLALIDRATWETRVVVNELAKRQGIDPDALVAEAIRKDNEK